MLTQFSTRQSRLTMTMRSKLLLCSLALLLSGCDKTIRTTVCLTLPIQTQEGQMTVSAADPQVQEALRIIYKVMLSQNLPRATRPPAAEDKAQGIIASYGRCSVWLATNTLNVGFVEFGPRRSGAFVRET